MSFTRLRVTSHSLKFEKGKWSRVTRINRVCQCDRRSVQDERHVLLECPLSEHVRLQYQMLPLESMSSLMKCNNVIDLCNFVRDILRIYRWNKVCLKSIDGAIFNGAHFSQQPKNITIYTKRLPKKIYIKFIILNICYDFDRNICTCLYTGSYYQLCYST